MAPDCPYCRRPALLRTCDDFYGKTGKWSGQVLWVCYACDARVSCHPGTNVPLGTLADAPLRAARMRVHHTFDPLWRSKGGRNIMSRESAYRWLADKMSMDHDQCHVALFTTEECMLAINLVNRYFRRSEDGTTTLRVEEN